MLVLGISSPMNDDTAIMNKNIEIVLANVIEGKEVGSKRLTHASATL